VSIYRAIVKVNGQRRSKSGKVLSEVLKAETKFKALRTSISRESPKNDQTIQSEQPPTTLDAIWIQWQANAQARGKKTLKSDVQRYRDHIQPSLGAMETTDIKPVHIQMIVDECLTTKGLAPSTVVQVFALIRAMLNYADRMDMTPDSYRNPCRKVRLPRFDNRVENPLTPEDFQNLESLCKSWPNQYTARVILFALYTGRRMGEVLKVEWADVDLLGGMVTFKAENTKSGKRQSVPLNDRAKSVLTAARESVPRNCRWVFPTQSTNRFYVGFHRDWQVLRRKANLSRHYRFHDLRHSFASRLVSRGVSLYMVKELLGHADIKTTMRYAHIDSGSLRDAASML
jgi:integrase